MAQIRSVPDAGEIVVEGGAGFLHVGNGPAVVLYIRHPDGIRSQLVLSCDEALSVAAQIPAAIEKAKREYAENKKITG